MLDGRIPSVTSGPAKVAGAGSRAVELGPSDRALSMPATAGRRMRRALPSKVVVEPLNLRLALAHRTKLLHLASTLPRICFSLHYFLIAKDQVCVGAGGTIARTAGCPVECDLSGLGGVVSGPNLPAAAPTPPLGALEPRPVTCMSCRSNMPGFMYVI